MEKKKVFIRTNSGRIYLGTIIKEDTNFITVLDKYNLEVRISIKDIEIIQEEKVWKSPKD